MSETGLTVHLPEADARELERIARESGQNIAEAGALLIQEGVRRHLYAGVEFRQTPTGRDAYLAGTRLAIWQVVQISREFEGDTERTAQHLDIPLAQIQAALNYAQAYPEEIEAAIADAEGGDFEKLSKIIPGLKG
jgi:uncharacterized protein (DUF433 family)